MLTNKIFEDFTSQLLQVRDAADFLKLSDGQGVTDTLNQAQIRFEDALSERLRGLSEAEQVGLLTQILTLFKDSKLYNRAPAYLWADLYKIAESGCEWVREHEELPSIKAFRDDCENQLLTDPQKFIMLPLMARYEASNANELLRMIDEYQPNSIICQLEGIELEDTELDYEESRWVRERLVSSAIEKAQENVRKHFQGLTGREQANHWILNPDSWYDVYRESIGLPWLQEKFQASYEAWHFYYQRPTKHIAEQTAQIYEPQARQAVSFRLGFTAENADQLAVCVGLIDEQGNYVGMPGVAAGRLYGFYWALRNKKKVNGSLELLRDYFALRYLKKLIPSKPNGNSNVAQDMIADTESALKRLHPTAN